MPHSNQNETYDVKRSIYIDLDVKIFTSIHKYSKFKVGNHVRIPKYQKIFC